MLGLNDDRPRRKKKSGGGSSPEFCSHGVPPGGNCSVTSCWNSTEKYRPIVRLTLRQVVEDAAEAIEAERKRERIRARRRQTRVEQDKARVKRIATRFEDTTPKGRAPRVMGDETV